MRSSTNILIFFSLVLPFLPHAFALPQQPTDDTTTPQPNNLGYAVASPPDQMNLVTFAHDQPYTGDSAGACSGSSSLTVFPPLPFNQSSCIFGVGAGPFGVAASVHNFTCVQSSTPDAALDRCNIIGFLDGSCESAPVQTQKTDNGWVFQGTEDVQSFKVDCTGAA